MAAGHGSCLHVLEECVHDSILQEGEELGRPAARQAPVAMLCLLHELYTALLAQHAVELNCAWVCHEFRQDHKLRR